MEVRGENRLSRSCCCFSLLCVRVCARRERCLCAGRTHQPAYSPLSTLLFGGARDEKWANERIFNARRVKMRAPLFMPAAPLTITLRVERAITDTRHPTTHTLCARSKPRRICLPENSQALISLFRGCAQRSILHETAKI